jgi:hypothetical protein
MKDARSASHARAVSRRAQDRAAAGKMPRSWVGGLPGLQQFFAQCWLFPSRIAPSGLKFP